MQAIRIGSFEVRAPEVWRQDFETASWYRDIEVRPGRYDVVAYPTLDHIGHTLYVRATGTCVSSYFESRLLWARSAHRDEDVGRDFAVQKMLVPYDVGQWLESGQLVLDFDAVVVEEWTSKRTVYDWANGGLGSGTVEVALRAVRLRPAGRRVAA